MAITSGVYEIAPYSTPTNRVDVASASKELYANIRYWTPNDTNAQKFKVTTDSVYSSVNIVENVNSGYVLDVLHGTMANSTNVIQYKNWGDSDSVNKPSQRWYIDTTTDTVSSRNGTNDEVITCKKLRNYKSSSFVLDSLHGYTTHGSNILIYTDWVDDATNTPAQRFAFLKSSVLDETIPTPYGIGFSTDTVETGESLIVATGHPITYYYAWEGSSSKYQYRLRYKRRYNGTNNWTSYSAWEGGYSKSGNDNGWGDAWSTATTTEDAGNNIWHGPSIVLVLQLDYDATIYQLEVRGADAAGSSTYGLTHGNSVTQDILVTREPDAGISSVTFNGSSIVISGATTYPRTDSRISNLSVTIGDEVLLSDISLATAKSTWTVTVPFSELNFIPTSGATCVVSYDFITVDASYSKSISAFISYASLHVSGSTPLFTERDGYGLIADVGPYHELSYMSISYTQAGKTKHEMLDTVDGVAEFYPPFNSTYTLSVVSLESSGDWSTVSVTKDGPVCSYLVWNWEDGTAVLAVAEGDNPNVSDTISRDFTTALTTGAEYATVDFGVGSDRTLTAAGSIVPALNINYSDLDSVEGLADAGSATFRLPSGRLFKVAITGVSTTLKGQRDTAVSVSMIVTG